MVVDTLVLIAAVGLARPGPLRPREPIPIPRVSSDLRLEDQAEVAAQIEAEFGSRRLLFLDHAELPFLMRYRNPLPYIYWNNATYSYARGRGGQGEEEDIVEVAVRLVREVDPDAYMIKARWLRAPLSGYTTRFFGSVGGRYQVALFTRDRGRVN